MNPELLSVAHRCLMQLAEVRAEHTVLVVTDAETQVVGEAFAAAAEPLARHVLLLRMPTGTKHGEEPPAVVAAAMSGADVIVQAVKYSLTHTDATRAALAANAQVFVLRGATEEMLLSDIVNVDFEELKRVTGAVAQRLSDGSTISVTTPLGTDLRLGIQGRQARALAGGTSPGRFGGPRSGEAAIAPVEGMAQGVVVIEHSMDNLGLLDAPIELTVTDGRVTSIRGGESAAQLRRILAESDENATNLAEFAIGTNPNARLTGNLATDKKVRGSVHVALGDSLSLGGTVRSDVHLDGMLLKPTVLVDGSPVVVAGELVLDRPAEAAASGSLQPQGGTP